MKKKILLAAATVFLAALLTVCAACGFFVSEEPYPYEIAGTRGEDASSDSFLSSLEAPTTELRRAYEEAYSDGSFTGSYFEFLQQLGIKEPNGAYVQQALLSVVSVYAKFTFASNGEGYYSVGAGVIYSLDKSAGDAYIVTNYHVVYSSLSTGDEAIEHISDDISIFLYGGMVTARTITATYLGGAMEYDIAVLSVKDSPVLKETASNPVSAREIVAGNSDAVALGERVYAIGNPGGEGISVVDGVISVQAETIDILAANGVNMINLLVMRMDAPVNHGNSGGGLFDVSGELIGIVNARSEEEGVIGYGYAIPANLAMALAQNIIDNCTLDPRSHCGAGARLGVTVQATDSYAAYDEQYGRVVIRQTITVQEVTDGTAGSAAGLKPGDVLDTIKLSSTRANEPYERQISVLQSYMISNLLFDVRFGDTLEIGIIREGKPQTLSVTYSNRDYFRSLL